MKYYETKKFKSLQREWYGKLKESGFDDIECGLENEAKSNGRRGGLNTEGGPFRSPASTYVPHSEFSLGASEADGLARQSADFVSAVTGIHEVAAKAFRSRKFWDGLPGLAKRWWGLQVQYGMSPDAAMKRVGLKGGSGYEKTKAWGDEIKRRIARRR